MDNLNLTLDNLRELNEDHIKLVSKEAVLQTCLNPTKEQGEEVFQLWVQKLLKVKVFTAQLNAEDWQQMTKYLKNSFQELENNLNTNNVDVNKLKPWLTNTLELLRYNQRDICSLASFALHCRRTCIVLAFTLCIVISCWNFYKKWSLDNERNKCLQDTIILHQFIVQVINDNAENFNAETEIEFLDITELIPLLSEIAEQTTSVDIKTSLETWKCVVRLMCQCAKVSNLKTTNPKGTYKWAIKPITFLLQKVARHIKVIYNRETSKQSTLQIDKYLRVTNFYLKLLLRLTADFKHEKFPVIYEFLYTFSQSKSLPKFIRGTQIADMFGKYIQNPLSDIFRLVYKNSEISKFILQCIKERREDSFSNFAIELLKAHVSGLDSKLIDYDVKAYTKLFEYILNEAATFIHTDRYNETIELYAALTILNESSVLKTYFQTNILKADFLIAHASADILLIVLRYSHDRTTANELLKEFSFWRRCNEIFALFSNNSKQFQIQRMLRHTFDLCKSNCEISKKVQYPEIKMSRDNYRFFCTVGLAKTSYSKESLGFITIKLTDELFELCNKFENGCSVENYYKMLVYLEMLSTAAAAGVLKPKLYEKLLKIITIIYSNERCKTERFLLLLNACFKLACTANYRIQSKFLECLQSNMHQHKYTPTITMINFLNNCCSGANIEQHKTASSILADANAKAGNKLIPAIFFKSQLDKCTVCKMDLELYQQIICTEKVQHICIEPENGNSQVNKRLRLDDKNKNENVQHILKDILENSKKVINLTHKLDDSSMCTLKTIVHTLSNVLQNKD